MGPYRALYRALFRALFGWVGWCVGLFSFLFGTHKLTLGLVDLFGATKRRCLSEWGFGEIEFANDRLKMNSNVNPTSWC